MKKGITLTNKNIAKIFKEVSEKLDENGKILRGRKLSGHYFYKGHDIYFEGIRELKKLIKIIDKK